jgi:hypothetical protein
MLPHIRPGPIEALALTSAMRRSALPDVPTTAELYAGMYIEASTNKIPPISQTRAHVTSVATSQSCASRFMTGVDSTMQVTAKTVARRPCMTASLVLPRATDTSIVIRRYEAFRVLPSLMRSCRQGRIGFDEWLRRSQARA